MIDTLVVAYFVVGAGYGIHKLIRNVKAALKSANDWIDLVFIVIGWPFAAWLEYKKEE